MPFRHTLPAGIAAALLSIPLAAARADAQLSLPIRGTWAQGSDAGTIEATLQITRFVELNGQVAAVGTLNATVLDAAGNLVQSIVQGDRLISLPVIRAGAAEATSSTSLEGSGSTPVVGTAGAGTPVTASGVAGAPATPNPVGQPATGIAVQTQEAGLQPACEPLHIEVGSLNFNLLGRSVNLDRAVVDITAELRPNNRFGESLCSITDALQRQQQEPARQLVASLNQLLERP